MSGARRSVAGELDERRLRRAVIALATMPALALLAAEKWVFGDLAGFPLDDSWIHLQFARHLAAGAGLSLHAGERVAGSTAPLWTALLAALSLLPGSPLAWSKLAGMASQLALLALTWRLGRRFALPPALAALAVLLVGTTDWLVFAAASGMETSLATALVLAGLLRHVDERRDRKLAPVSMLVFALAALARPEALLLLPLAVADRTLLRRPGAGIGTSIRELVPGLAAALLLLLAIGAAFQAISGSPLPTTLAAKSPGAPGWLPRLADLRVVLDLLFASQPLPTLLAAAGAVELIRRRGTERDGGLLLPLWCLAMPLAASALTAPGAKLAAGNFGRYFFPLLPVVVLLGCLGLQPLSRSGERGPRTINRRSALAALGFLLLLGAPLARTARVIPLYLEARGEVERSDGAAAEWIAAHVPASALLAAVDIGVLSYRVPNAIVDLGGIADPELMRFLARQRSEAGLDWQRALELWIERRQPEYVLLYPSWFPRLESQPQRFPALARFRIPGNIAMAGPELVVYSTPWTRKDAPP